MAETLRLEVVTPSRRVLEVRADEVRIPGALGELGILPGHTPLLTSLGTGELKWTEGSERGRLVIQGGFAEVQPDAVTVLATIAETVDEIDVEKARTILAEAQEALRTVTAEDFDEIDGTVRLAEAQINATAGSGA
ncbi:MAG: F0F1 ATP synthase subunit epsilon [Acidobacteria bacterium]|jgi:F-type H+-transporting ATPase subunit epsilon|nr:F0F1 ATP synthase subunit epsilon [Candidatus Sulfomarinibacter sp. MAG AM1]